MTTFMVMMVAVGIWIKNKISCKVIRNNAVSCARNAAKQLNPGLCKSVLRTGTNTAAENDIYTVLMDTYAHTQDKPRLELAEKLEADFYSQDIGSPKSGSVPVKENLPDSIQITPEGMLKVVRQMNPEQRREFTRLLFA